MKFQQTASLVTTCYNEIGNIDKWIGCVKSQSYAVDEICIVDAGSTDGTLEKLDMWAKNDLRVLVKVVKKCNVAQGRNEAIRISSGEIIISTDMGCRLDSEWVLEMLKPFAEKTTAVVAGNYGPDMETIKTTVAKLFYCLNGMYRPRLGEDFLPSSRSIAYLRLVWESVGGYNECLTFAGDDTLFAVKTRDMGYPFRLSPKAMVFWGRHPTLRDYCKEAERYGLGDAEASLFLKHFLLEKLPHFMKYLAVFVGLLVASLHFDYYARIADFFSLIIIGISCGLFIVQAKRTVRSLMRCDCKLLRHTLYAIIMKDLVDISYCRGYFRGLFKSFQSATTDEA